MQSAVSVVCNSSITSKCVLTRFQAQRDCYLCFHTQPLKVAETRGFILTPHTPVESDLLATVASPFIVCSVYENWIL